MSTATATAPPNPVERIPGGGAGPTPACASASVDRELFFAPDGERETARKVRERAARRVCASCPIRLACLEDALERDERYGVWGGLTEEERAVTRAFQHQAGAEELAS